MYKGIDFRFLSLASRLTCADDSYRKTSCKSDCSPFSFTELNFPRMLHFLSISFGEFLLYSWYLSEWKLLLKAKELLKKKKIQQWFSKEIHRDQDLGWSVQARLSHHLQLLQENSKTNLGQSCPSRSCLWLLYPRPHKWNKPRRILISTAPRTKSTSQK